MAEQSISRSRRVWLILWAVLPAVLLIGIVVGIWAGSTHQNGWTGFNAYQSQGGDTERGKTLWDWLNLFIIPAVLGLGALSVNHISQQNEQKRADRENQIEREIAHSSIKTTLEYYQDVDEDDLRAAGRLLNKRKKQAEEEETPDEE